MKALVTVSRAMFPLPTNAARFMTSLKTQLAGGKLPAILRQEAGEKSYLLFLN